MTAHLVVACQEVDDQLLECLLTWSEVTDQERDHRHLAPLHRHYAERSWRLIEARTAIESALRVLDVRGAVSPEMAADTGQQAEGRPDKAAPAPEAGHGIQVCRCSVTARTVSVSGASVSRPDRSQRPEAECRGQIRDWNRDILACRTHGTAAGIRADGCGAYASSSGTGPADGQASAQPSVSGEDLNEVVVAARAAGAPDRDRQLPEQADVKEPENGKQGNSNRSRKRS